MTAYDEISQAIRARQDEQAITLIKSNGEGARHWKPIMDAAYVGAPEVVRALLAAGADPDTVSGTGHERRGRQERATSCRDTGGETSDRPVPHRSQRHK
jgi:hypothetical protein